MVSVIFQCGRASWILALKLLAVWWVKWRGYGWLPGTFYQPCLSPGGGLAVGAHLATSTVPGLPVGRTGSAA